jgi:hypothetical protein
MLRVRVAAFAGFPGKPRGRSERECNSDTLPDLVIQGLIAQDVVVLEAIGQGALLVQHVTVQWVFRPEVSRQQLQAAWIDALAEVAKAVQVLDDMSGGPAQKHQSGPEDHASGQDLVDQELPGASPRRLGRKGVKRG